MRGDEAAIEVFEELGFWQLRLQREIERLEGLDGREVRRGNASTRPIFLPLRYFEFDKIAEIRKRLRMFTKPCAVIFQDRG